MFDPKKASKDKGQKAAKKKAIAELKNWCLSMVPEELKQGLRLDVNEIVCGDPSCAPIDTVFQFLWDPAGKGMFAIPASTLEIEQEDLIDFFPDEETLGLWKEGKKAPWPKPPELRFKLDDRVECRVGPHPVKGWAPGRIIKLYYSEPNWPPNMLAPYQIALHDGRLIFAPQDTDDVIRLRPPAAPDAPSSPVINPDDYEGGAGNDDDEEEEEDEEGGEEQEEDMDEGDEGVAGGEGKGGDAGGDAGGGAAAISSSSANS